MNQKIALVTYQDEGAYHQINVANEDDLLIKFLTDKGLNIEKAIWNDPKIQWETYSLVIVKSPWDYFDYIGDFYNWLEKLKQLHVKVLNPIETLTWNADKHYLQDIEKEGLAITPSVFIETGEKPNLAPYFHRFTTEKLIIKPAVSGGSKNTFKVTSANLTEIEQELEDLLKVESFIVQPFLSEIESNGEWSFIFFGGKFSHALLKKAKEGDFRVQATFGGTVHPQNPSSALLETAQQYVDVFARNCLYARVDGTIVNGELMLMELELIEPFLFLDIAAGNFENYYQALLGLMEF